MMITQIVRLAGKSLERCDSDKALAAMVGPVWRGEAATLSFHCFRSQSQ